MIPRPINRTRFEWWSELGWMTKDDNLSRVWKNDKFSSKGKRMMMSTQQNCTSMNVVPDWLADWLTDWLPVRSDGKQYIKEIVSYNHVVPLFWILQRIAWFRVIFSTYFQIFQHIFNSSKNIWGWGNQMATYEKTKKKKIDGLTRH